MPRRYSNSKRKYSKKRKSPKKRSHRKKRASPMSALVIFPMPGQGVKKIQRQRRRLSKRNGGSSRRFGFTV